MVRRAIHDVDSRKENTKAHHNEVKTKKKFEFLRGGSDSRLPVKMAPEQTI